VPRHVEGVSVCSDAADFFGDEGNHKVIVS
jgi:hypothetical protein